MPNKFDLKTNFGTDAELTRSMDFAAKLFGNVNAIDIAVRAASQPLIQRARQLAPRSSVTGTSRYRSAKQRSEADWEYPLWKTINRVVRLYGQRKKSKGVAVVGPEWPKGNKAYFNTSPNGRKVWYWGKDANKKKAQVRNWIVQAFDETKQQQLTAMKDSIKQSLDEAMRLR